MPRTQESTPFYIRTQEGSTYYVDTLQEALEEFLGSDGYRLSLTAGQNQLVIRRCLDWSPDPFGSKECEATLVYREPLEEQ